MKDGKQDRRLYQQFRRQLVFDPRFKRKDRGMLQIKMLTRNSKGNRPFTMAPAKQANQLNASAWVENKLRRVAITSGLFKITSGVLERNEIDGQLFNERFTSCPLMGLELRTCDLLIDMASGSKDGWAQPTKAELAKQLKASPGSMDKVIQSIQGHGMFETKKSGSAKRIPPET